MTIKRNRSSKREAMDWMELRREATRFERERQYLKHGTETHTISGHRSAPGARPAPTRLYRVSHISAGCRIGRGDA